MKIFSITLISLMLTGCGLFGSRIEDSRPSPVVTTHTTQLAYECPPPPQVDNFEARDIEWDVASRQELDGVMLELLTELNVPEEDISIINQEVGDFFFHPDDETRWSLSAEGYADLGRNTSDVLAAMRQLKAVVQHYKQCITDSKEAAREANEQVETEVSEE